jgi:hypothetical protein
VTFHAHALEDFHLDIEIDPIPIATYLALSSAMGQPGSLCEDLILQGMAENGTSFISETVYLRGMNHGETASITVGARKATITLVRDEVVERPVMRLWLRSFKSWNNPIVETPMGDVQVKGASTVESVEDVSGNVAVQAKTATVPADWAEKADDFLTFMMRGLAFAHGSRLQTPRCDLHIENRSEITFYEGAASRSGFHNVPSLAQGDFIKALAARYDATPPLSDMVWTAVGWSQLDITSDQSRFVNCMTALETIVEHLIPKGQTTVMLKPAFAIIRDLLIALVQASGLSKDEKEIFVGKIQNMNSRTLSQKIEALRAHYGLPADKYDTSTIVTVIKLRNAIIHKGAPDQEGLWPDILFVRELIADIVFSELKYMGVRVSYLGGHKIVHPNLDASDGDADIAVD